MATRSPKRCYTILPRERGPCCANTYVADPDDEEEPCGVCWVMQCDHINPQAKEKGGDVCATP